MGQDHEDRPENGTEEVTGVSEYLDQSESE